MLQGTTGIAIMSLSHLVGFTKRLACETPVLLKRSNSHMALPEKLAFRKMVSRAGSRLGSLPKGQ